MSRPKLLDLFCKAGGCSVGYDRAGFDVTGVDIEPQKNYPFTFHQADALEFLEARGHEFDVIHASPPCQAYSTMARMGKAGWKPRKHPELIEPTREALQSVGITYVIENVVGAPLLSPLQLCGSSFALGVRRHRLFESDFLLLGLPCRHSEQPAPIAVYGDHPQGASLRIRRARSVEEARDAMGIDYMNWRELTQAIPPAYTEFIGRQLLAAIEVSS